MNIFFLSLDPKNCALYHLDVHVVKMILETVQLLFSAHHLSKSDLTTCPEVYKLTHQNHPCAIWTRENVNNYIWLCKLGIELCHEYTYRYNKIHKCQNIMIWLKDNLPSLPNEEFKTPPQCMPDEYKHEDTIIAYRQYYVNAKGNLQRVSYKKRDFPYWWSSTKIIETPIKNIVERTQCSSMTKKGIQCKNKANEEGSCHLHKRN